MRDIIDTLVGISESKGTGADEESRPEISGVAILHEMAESEVTGTNGKKRLDSCPEI